MKKSSKAELVKAVTGEAPTDTPKMDIPIVIQNHQFSIKLDTEKFISVGLETAGETAVQQYESSLRASKHDLQCSELSWVAPKSQ